MAMWFVCLVLCPAALLACLLPCLLACLLGVHTVDGREESGGEERRGEWVVGGKGGAAGRILSGPVCVSADASCRVVSCAGKLTQVVEAQAKTTRQLDQVVEMLEKLRPPQH